jgi:hypothetical protein
MKAFLNAAGWGAARQEALAGDASARRYIRLHGAQGTAILMIDAEGDVALFARLARHLIAAGLSAPRILAEDPAAGLLLIEDLGDGLLARLARDPAAELPLYRLATEALVTLHRAAPPPGLPVATPERLAEMIEPGFTQYTHAPALMAEVQAALLPLLQAHAAPASVMVLRDYHAENILHLPERPGARAAGLLDFQDALLGHPAYDLISLLEDARRDVAEPTRAACIAQYCAATHTEPAGFEAALAVLGCQRNLRILGIFARLARLRGKPQYIDLIPRVWGHLARDLSHPALAALRPLLAALPAPDTAYLQGLKTPCPTP